VAAAGGHIRLQAGGQFSTATCQSRQDHSGTQALYLCQNYLKNIEKADLYVWVVQPLLLAALMWH
jgi:hypothetical protein